jgi:DtxR family Mn-dependent transcriptional regulator
LHRKPALSETHEMYLKTLYHVRSKHDIARVGDLADGLGVSPGTVTGVLKKLRRMELVEHEKYGVVSLTPMGHRMAECVLHRFETLRDVLIEVFGVDPETAEVDACMMEHAVSPLTAHRMKAFLMLTREGKPPLPGDLTRLPSTDPCSSCEELSACEAVTFLEERDEKT